VTDRSGEMDADDTVVTVADTTPPVVSCSVTPGMAGVTDDDDDSDSDSDDGDGDRDDDDGFRLSFEATDACGPATVSAILDVGCAEIPVADGQLISFEHDDECEVETDDGVVEVESWIAMLVVTATDAAGNTAYCTAEVYSPDLARAGHGCGLGVELVLLLPAGVWLQRRRQLRRARRSNSSASCASTPSATSPAAATPAGSGRASTSPRSTR